MIPFLDSANCVINRINQKTSTKGDKRYALKLKFPEAYEKSRQRKQKTVSVKICENFRSFIIYTLQIHHLFR